MKSLPEISYREVHDYQRDNFDRFLKKVGFKFELPAIHIAGTNGKGSTANFINNIYISGGYKVGIFSSPSFYDVNEMMKVNNKPLLDERILSIFNEYKKDFEKFELSQYEVLTFIAFTLFKEENCDICIIECCMGGLLDCTNIFTPVLSIITTISLEHTTFLGKTLSEIAEQKGGIIKEDIPVLIGEFESDAHETILSISKELDAPVSIVGKPANVNVDATITFDYLTLKNIHLNTGALYCVDDACFAIDAVKLLESKFPVSNEQIIAGLSCEALPGRCEIICQNPLIILDGAHNPEAMFTLKKTIGILQKNKAISTVFSTFKDKNLPQLLASVGEFSSNVALTTFDHPRARKFEDYFLYADEYPFTENPIECIKNEIISHKENLILITGSLAFVGYVRKLFKEGIFDNEINTSKE